MKIAHCPHCQNIQSSIATLNFRDMSRRQWRRAHSTHNVTRYGRRALIRNGRKA